MAKNLVTLGPSRADLAPALRIAASFAVPLVLLLVTGHVAWSLFASMGAFTSIYARYVPTAVRARQHLLIGTVLTVGVGVGALLAQLAADGVIIPAVHAGLSVLAGSLAAAIGSVIVLVSGMRPAGAVFPVFSVTAVASAPSSAPFWLALLIAAGSATWCVLLGLAAHWTGEAHQDVAAPAAPGIPWDMRREEATQYGLTALVSGVIASFTGLASPYWAQVAAVVPLSAPGRRMQFERGVHRIVGTAFGVALAAFLLSFPSQHWQLVVWAVLLQFLAEMFVLRNYALALVFITPLALLLVQLAAPRPVGPLLLARVSETVIGAVVGICAVLVAVLLERRRARR